MSFKTKLLLLSTCSFFLTICTINAIATPAQIIIIRHGEKPVNSNELNLKGQERAAALAPYFLTTKALVQYGPSVAIYAQQPNGDDPSLRPLQTCLPTATALHLQVNTQYGHQQY